ncbi:MAG TPA: hypothetical protein VNH18_03420 [Bryobacteraceae bacterium]|nr:hypothetical protein [Bryobacteraceae bacterium]
MQQFDEGAETEEPIAEDWGWIVPVANDQFRLWIGCANYQEYADGFLCFIEPHTPFVRKLLKKIDTQEGVGSLRRAMDKILTETADIRGKRWWTYDEFTNPALHHHPSISSLL